MHLLGSEVRLPGGRVWGVGLPPGSLHWSLEVPPQTPHRLPCAPALRSPPPRARLLSPGNTPFFLHGHDEIRIGRALRQGLPHSNISKC